MKLILLVVILLPGLLVAQVKNAVLDEFEEGAPPYKPSIAVNPKDPENIILYALGNFYITHDGGEEWAKKVAVSDLANPRIICDKKGNFYYFGTTNDNLISFYHSKDDGDSWEKISEIKPEGKPLICEASSDRKGNLYLTWTSIMKDGGNCSSNIMFTTSTTRGKKWDEPLIINQVSGGCEKEEVQAIGAMPAITADDKIFISWVNNGTVYLDRSYNEGKIWLRNDIEVTNHINGWQNSIPGVTQAKSWPVLLADRSNTRLHGMIYLSWTDQRTGSPGTDIFFLSSHNGGDTWSSTLTVNDDTSESHQFLSSMSQDPETGFIYLTFYDRRNYDDNKTDVYLAYSKNGGRSFQNIKISKAPFIPDGAENLGTFTEAHEGKVISTWISIEGGITSLNTTVVSQEELDIQSGHQ